MSDDAPVDPLLKDPMAEEHLSEPAIEDAGAAADLAAAELTAGDASVAGEVEAGEAAAAAEPSNEDAAAPAELAAEDAEAAAELAAENAAIPAEAAAAADVPVPAKEKSSSVNLSDSDEDGGLLVSGAPKAQPTAAAVNAAPDADPDATAPAVDAANAADADPAATAPAADAAGAADEDEGEDGKPKLIDSKSVRQRQQSEGKRSPSSAVDAIEHMSVRAPSPSKRASQGPWLQGTFTTPKGRKMTADEFCSSLDRMYNYGAEARSRPQSGANKCGPGPQPKVKQVSTDELDGIVQRLSRQKESASPGGKLECKQLAFRENKEVWEPVKKRPDAENTEYLRTLYDRCLSSKKASEAKLAAKWLKPLGRPATAKH